MGEEEVERGIGDRGFGPCDVIMAKVKVGTAVHGIAETETEPEIKGDEDADAAVDGLTRR